MSRAKSEEKYPNETADSLFSLLKHPNVLYPPSRNQADKTLAEVLHADKHKSSPKEMLNIALQIAQGINYLHSRDPQVIHGNLDTDRILVSSDLSSVKVIMEIPEKLAPEEQKSSIPSELTDLAGFGAILYEVVMKRKLVSNAKDDDLNILNYRIVPGLDALVQDCIREERAKNLSFETIVRNRIPSLMNRIERVEHRITDEEAKELAFRMNTIREVSTLYAPNPDNCVLEGLPAAIPIHTKTNVLLVLKNMFGSRIRIPAIPNDGCTRFQVTLRQENKEEGILVPAKQVREGKVEFSFSVKTQGKYSLEVQVCSLADGKLMPITNSPFEFSAELQRRGTKKVHHKSHSVPAAVSVLSNDWFAVADKSANKVSVFNHEGEFQHQFDKAGGKEFNEPYGLCSVLKKGRDLLIIADTNENRVVIMSVIGEFKRAITFKKPKGVSVDKERNIYCCGGDSLLASFNWKGEVRWKTKGAVTFPRHLCFSDESHQLFVADSGTNVIRVFDVRSNKPKEIKAFGTEGKETQPFNKPTGICINANGRLMISDLNNHRIVVYDWDGREATFRGVILHQGLNSPRGVDTDSKNRVIVTNKEFVQVISGVLPLNVDPQPAE